MGRNKAISFLYSSIGEYSVKTISVLLVPFVLFISPAVPAAGDVQGPGARGDQTVIVVDSDSLVAGIDRYAGRKIETCGTIIHVCGVDGKKMKLRTAGDFKIKVVPGEGMSAFDAGTYKDKYVKVRGLVRETRIDEKYIEKMERERKVLCHVDHTPCISTLWTAEQERNGKADSLSMLATNKLRERLKTGGKGYISIVTIEANFCEVIDNAGK
jgi:hypothetical protein